jgi:hypothetical protein
MTRRKFLQQAGLGALAAGSLPTATLAAIRSDRADEDHAGRCGDFSQTCTRPCRYNRTMRSDAMPFSALRVSTISGAFSTNPL